MKNTVKFRIIAFAALIAFSMSACDDEIDNGGEEETGVSVTVAPKNYIVHRGYNQSFIAAVKGTEDKAVIWSIEGEGLHKDTVIGENGLLSVSKDEEQTELTIKAVLAADPGIYGTAKVSIPEPTVIGVEISLTGGIEIYPWHPKNKTIDVDRGNTEQFQAIVTGENFPDETVTWSIPPGTVNEGTIIDEDGFLTVSPSETPNKIFTVKAVSKADPAKSDIITVTVQPPTITYFRVVPSDTVISPTTPVEFTVTVLGSGNIQGLYELSAWSVVRSDNRDIAIDESKEDPDDPGTIVTISGTKFEGNTLHMGPDEKLGEWSGDDETGTYTPYSKFTLDVTITISSQLNIAATVERTIKVSLIPDAGIVESQELL